MSGDDKPKRIRIKSPVIETFIVDPLKYGVNASTQNARQDCTINIKYDVEIWYDEHVSIRQLERDGIEIDVLKKLASKSFKHIFYYQLRYPLVKLLQYPERKGRNYRFVLKEQCEDGALLNITCELHFLDAGLYEMTFITAMITNSFKIFDGQYIVKVDGESSTLSKLENGTIKLIAEVK
ncbi:hypothetical protein [Flavobacterium subsaxonicum]|uniref:Uncharacterized protein n=1 Tax=Flavobacterium subsaxonicum WB 4.1-42 = DSM 21790 TaxID=1121898 RepID=A0A0A2MFD4_9FLAO|nr:hypothetical protein [Flavobacterium subsaxonicum]KGO90999.1 hypothetical protein Q766_20395 [Flavobacterium subsaxonicum WB 4.1-42 = DSM 21790]